MTREEREEAIDSLEIIRETFLKCYGEETVIDVPIDGDDMRAFDMAIEALKAEPCGDYINIHDAVEVVWNKLSDGYAEKAHSSLDVRDWFADLPRIKFAEDIVKEMDERGTVSVPENCMTGEKYEEWLYKENPCGDVIDRQALRAQFNHLDEVYEGMSEEEEHEAYIYGQIIRAIDDAPSITPKQRWIPVDYDRYPETYPKAFQEVWMLDGYGEVIHKAYDGTRSIKAWMPYVIPEPYKEGEIE